jgi:hypothetical protein
MRAAASHAPPERVPGRTPVSGAWNTFEEAEAEKQARRRAVRCAGTAAAPHRTSRATDALLRRSPCRACRFARSAQHHHALTRRRARSALSPWSQTQGSLAALPSAEALLWASQGEYAPTEVDDRDKGTPDEWIARHPELVRLTGALCAVWHACWACVGLACAACAAPRAPRALTRRSHARRRPPPVQLRAAVEQADGDGLPHARCDPLRAQPRSGAALRLGHAHHHPHRRARMHTATPLPSTRRCRPACAASTRALLHT